MEKENSKKKRKWNSYLVIGFIMTGITLAIAVVGAFWTPYEATAMSASEKFVSPSLTHLFARIHLTHSRKNLFIKSFFLYYGV